MSTVQRSGPPGKPGGPDHDHSGNGHAPYASIRHAAVEALACGISVVPPAEDGTKRPGVGGWKKFQVDRTTLDGVLDWYGIEGKPRRGGLGAVCGGISGNLEVFEFDAQGLAYEPFRAAAAALGYGEVVERIESGYSERTPSNGIHWAYRCATIAGNTVLASHESDEVDEKTGRARVRPLIETRGEGGYIILAPSGGNVHPTKRPYVLLRGGFKTIATITPEERQALWDLARTFDRTPDVVTATPVERDLRKRHASDHGDCLTPWDDFNARTTWPEILPAGWATVYRQGETAYLRRPGKAQGVSATIGRNGSDRLFVFSSSTEFEPNKPYSKFDAYARLHHAGDTRKATAELSQRGYGEYRTWVHEDEQWRLVTRPNPVPKGVRIAKPGEAPPASRVKSVPATPSANGNGDGHAEQPGRPPSLNQKLAGRPRTDLGNAERLVARHGGDLRYCHPWKKWLVWDGRRFQVDSTAEVRRRARRTVRAIFGEAKTIDDDEKRKGHALWQLTSEKRDRLAAMVSLAEAEEGIPVLPENLDNHPWLLNCMNGTLDLKSGQLRAHSKDDGFTQLCPTPYQRDAPCPLWLATLNTIFGGQHDMVGFTQRLFGYCLTGATTEQILPILFGTGSNGKSTILGVLLKMLGPDYSMKAMPDLLMVKRSETHPTDKADLFGKRLVVAIETEEGARLNESLIKELTGSDPIRARRMREDPWQFDPTHKVLLCTNHEPAVRGTDHAIWRRLKKIEFSVKIADDAADKDLPAKLLRELPGVLAWCVQGLRDWQDGGLNPPQQVIDATEEYRRSEDILGAFLSEHCTTIPSLRTKASVLYDRYRKWAEASGYQVANQMKFGKAMTERGFTRVANNGIWYKDIGLQQEGSDTY